MKKEFKVFYGFKPTEYYAIHADDLAKAYYAFINETKVIFNSGEAIHGRDIKRIEPNWSALMGWSHDYIPNGEDMSRIPKNEYTRVYGVLGKSKDIAREAITTKNLSLLENKTKLIG